MSDKDTVGAPVFNLKYQSAEQFAKKQRALAIKMTIRDWFAGQAMSGMLVADDRRASDTLAKWAYMIADAMIQEREGGAK